MILKDLVLHEIRFVYWNRYPKKRLKFSSKSDIFEANFCKTFECLFPGDTVTVNVKSISELAPQIYKIHYPKKVLHHTVGNDFAIIQSLESMTIFMKASKEEIVMQKLSNGKIIHREKLKKYR